MTLGKLGSLTVLLELKFYPSLAAFLATYSYYKLEKSPIDSISYLLVIFDDVGSKNQHDPDLNYDELQVNNM